MNDSARQSAVVAASVATITARMPPSVDVDGLALSLLPTADTRGDHARFVGTWSSAGGRGDAIVDVSRAGGSMSQLEVSLSPARGGMRAWHWNTRHRGEAAATLASALMRTIEGRPVAPAPRPDPRPRRAVRVAVPAVAVAVVALAVVAANLFAPPKPVSVEAATARFREATATPAATSAEAKQPAAPKKQRVAARKGSGKRQAKSATPAQVAPDEDETQVAAVTTTRRRPERRDPQRQSRSEPVLPEEGVYRYSTEGYEELDVPNGHREFPEESTQTIRHTDCGHTVRWDPMEQRWDENDLCPRNGMSQPVEFRTHREFFGRSVDQRFVCNPLPTPEGAMWAQRCESEDTTMTTVARSLGTRTMVVDGKKVEVAGLQTDSRMRGANTGTRRGQLWHARDTGVMVHTEVQGQLESDGPFGRVTYREQYMLHLASFKAYR